MRNLGEAVKDTLKILIILVSVVILTVLVVTYLGPDKNSVENKIREEEADILEEYKNMGYSEDDAQYIVESKKARGEDGVSNGIGIEEQKKILEELKNKRN